MRRMHDFIMIVFSLVVVALFTFPFLSQAAPREVIHSLTEELETWDVEKTWSKAEILEAYLNLVTFRGELQGVQPLGARRPVALEPLSHVPELCAWNAHRLVRHPRNPPPDQHQPLAVEKGIDAESLLRTGPSPIDI